MDEWLTKREKKSFPPQVSMKMNLVLCVHMTTPAAKASNDNPIRF
jgi:hypothetical protein